MTARQQRFPVALLLLAPLVAAPLRAQGVEYSAGTTRYRLSTSTKGSQSSPMGNQDFQIDARQQLTVNIAKQTKDTMVATVTLDSLSVKSAQGAPDLSRLLGSRFVSYISPTGRVYSTRAAEGTDPVLAQVSESVARFLPTYRRDIGARMSWSDTVSGKITQQGLEVDRTIISRYTVAGDTAVAGEKVFKVERVSTTKAAGSGSAQGTPISLESATSSNGVFFLSPRGVYLGGRQNDDIAVKITIIAQGAEITIKQLAESTIEPIR
ncbi:MAG TPA: hypothetical protein VM033_01355 [Gemmatimonadaceae bacterium]|nr:hypothetical protein [Gemmatimonadaceae bacterium]